MRISRPDLSHSTRRSGSVERGVEVEHEFVLILPCHSRGGEDTGKGDPEPDAAERRAHEGDRVRVRGGRGTVGAHRAHAGDPALPGRRGGGAAGRRYARGKGGRSSLHAAAVDARDPGEDTAGNASGPGEERPGKRLDVHKETDSGEDNHGEM